MSVTERAVQPHVDAYLSKNIPVVSARFLDTQPEVEQRRRPTSSVSFEVSDVDMRRLLEAKGNVYAPHSEAGAAFVLVLNGETSNPNVPAVNVRPENVSLQKEGNQVVLQHCDSELIGKIEEGQGRGIKIQMSSWYKSFR